MSESHQALSLWQRLILLRTYLDEDVRFSRTHPKGGYPNQILTDF